MGKVLLVNLTRLQYGFYIVLNFNLHNDRCGFSHPSGAGQTGARRFLAYNIPPLQHWNENLIVLKEKSIEEEHDPSLTIELLDGTVKEINVKGLRV